MNEVKANDLVLKAVSIWFDKWLVLTAGTADDFNSMTVGWGSVGGMWKKPFVQVVVRPGRYTFEYMEKYPTFTLCAFPKQYKKSLMVLGTKSGRDSDKVAESGLTVVASEIVEAPAYREAELIFECRKTYWQDMHPDNFVDERIDANYPGKDYHRIYYGEIVRINADESYTD